MVAAIFLYALTLVFWVASYVTYYAFGDWPATTLAVAGGFILLAATGAHQNHLDMKGK